ncbi:hypothetical protein FIBSPDRAFT_1042145 [Athelia psychrophila]|uniref:Uncharacterized protein n=1 Tax=Athelia psychrophila TaxID=1759441 RepID=A0A166N6V6_9AGAM|nr:hypothetical protein FIBSPDRAFT_1042145 [Fibularhizoctonia sp. CBS 109695]
MRVALTAILSIFATSAVAYKVTGPTAKGWTTAGPNSLTWTRSATDPLNFTAVLTNPSNPSLANNQILAALVDGTLTTAPANPPSGGWTAGVGFVVNFVADATDLNTVLAQSVVFAIVPPNITSVSSTPAFATVAPNTIPPAAATSAITAPVGATGNGAGSLATSTGIAGAIAFLGAALLI